MKEKDIQIIFGKKNTITGCFELKLSKGISIRFDAVRPHQMKALKDVNSGKGLYHKINDPIFAGSKTRFASRKPFDCFLLREVLSYIVVCFYIPYKPKEFIYIKPKMWEKLEEESDKKSIRKEELIKNSNYYLKI